MLMEGNLWRSFVSSIVFVMLYSSKVLKLQASGVSKERRITVDLLSKVKSVEARAWRDLTGDS